MTDAARPVPPDTQHAQLRTGRRQLRPDRPAEGWPPSRRRRHRRSTCGARFRRSAGLARRIGLRGRRRAVHLASIVECLGSKAPGGRRWTASPAAASTTPSRRTPSRWRQRPHHRRRDAAGGAGLTGPPAAATGSATRSARRPRWPAGRRPATPAVAAWGGGETPALAGIVEAGRIDLAAVMHRPGQPEGRLSLGDQARRRRRHRAARLRAASTPTA